MSKLLSKRCQRQPSFMMAGTGKHEAARALDEHQAHFCGLAADCDKLRCVTLAQALCVKHQTNLIIRGNLGNGGPR
jgi:ribosomal protein L7Ae-like RNA K-turn-binding protein